MNFEPSVYLTPSLGISDTNRPVTNLTFNYFGTKYFHRAYDSGSSQYVSWVSLQPNLTPTTTTPSTVGPLIGIHIESRK